MKGRKDFQYTEREREIMKGNLLFNPYVMEKLIS